MISRPIWAGAACLTGAALAGVLYAAFSGPFPLQEFCTRNRPTWVLGLFTTPRYTAVTGPVFLAALAALSGLYLLALWAVRRVEGRAIQLVLLLGLPALFAALLLPTYPLLSNDIFKYVFDGRILTVYGENPFVKVPADFPEDRYYDLVYWKAVVSAHGPIWRIFQAAGAELGGERCATAIMAMKLWPTLAYFATIGLLYTMLRISDPGRSLPVTLTYAWCPLVLFEAVLNGHNDVVAALLLLLALWAARAQRWLFVPLLVAVGFLVKPLAALAAPVFLVAALRDGGVARRDIVIGATGAALLVVGAYAPFFAGFQTFQGMERSGIFSASPGELIVIVLESAGWPLDRAMLAARIVANGLFLAVLAVALWALWRGRLDLASALAAAFFGYLLLASQWFNPWYLLWLLPLALVSPSWRLRWLSLAFCLLAPLVYLLQYDSRLVVPLVFAPVAALAVIWRTSLGWSFAAQPSHRVGIGAQKMAGHG